MDNKAKELMRKYHYGFKHSKDLLEDEYVKDLNKEIGKLKAKIETADFRINKLCEILYDKDYLTTYDIMELQTALLRISEGL